MKIIKEIKMFNILKIATAISLFAFPVLADTYNTTGKITAVKPMYRTVSVPVTIQDCNDVQVPIYGQTGGGASGGDVLGGMIIGGLLGKGAGGDDKGAAIGAILGGMIAADNNQGQRVVTGYRTERQCQNATAYETRQELTDYLITYEVFGIQQTANVTNKYRVGQNIPVRVTVKLR